MAERGLRISCGSVRKNNLDVADTRRKSGTHVTDHIYETFLLFLTLLGVFGSLSFGQLCTFLRIDVNDAADEATVLS